MAEKKTAEVKAEEKKPAVKKPATQKAPAAKAAETAEKKPAVTKKPAAPKKTAAPKKPAVKKAAEVIIQSPLGGEITNAEILARVGNVDKVYVRVDENKAYWVRGEETGSVDLW